MYSTSILTCVAQLYTNTHLPLQVLINVGPAKPTRRLPESERKALLSESMEAANQSLEDMQGLEHDDTPQIVPYMETSFNDNNVPVPVKPVRVNSHCFMCAYLVWLL